MIAARTLTLALALSLALSAVMVAATPVRVRRQLADDDALQPLEDTEGDEQTREKRKFEGVTQAKFGIKNAVLGFVFGDGITSRRQVRSTNPERVSLLPKSTNTLALTNTDKALASTDEALASTNGHSSSISGRSKSTNGASSSSAASSNTAMSTKNASSNTKTALSSTKGSTTKSDRGARQADDIPVFDRNKVSLDFPGSLFGPSLSLLIRTTKIVGDVIQNSAVRYQSFLRLFRPLFRGPFEIKGLDPATTTTTTTTAAPKTSDNEILRR